MGDRDPVGLARPAVRRRSIFLAGLQAIPRDLHEAAAIDGANGWQRFRYITLPLLRPLIAIQILFGFIYSAYQFALPYVMMGTNPGPYADLMMTLIVRQSFGNTLFGYGAAISTLLMIAMFLCVLVWYRRSSATWWLRDERGERPPAADARPRAAAVDASLTVLTYVVVGLISRRSSGS